ncbi:MAG: HAD-IIB family hydrolase [Rhodothermales bacterium]|nr:HAD-IIB family hydrolase [Rhodothermales bacterium]
MIDKRIRLFISDIDGCLSEPFTPFDLDGIQELRRLAVTHRSPTAPLFSICTGRAFGYVEAMVQAIGFDMPVLFEAGGAMYDPKMYTISWAPQVTHEHRHQISEILQHWEKNYLGDVKISIDYAKKTQASIVIRDSEKMETLLGEIKETIETTYSAMVVADTHVSIDVLPEHLSKENGILWLADEVGIPVDDIAYIGDSTGDIAAIKRVGLGIAPANASEAVRDAADYVCEGSHIDAVLEAFSLCTRNNGRQE